MLCLILEDVTYFVKGTIWAVQKRSSNLFEYNVIEIGCDYAVFSTITTHSFKLI